MKTIYINRKSADSEIYHHVLKANPDATIKWIDHNTEAYKPAYGNVSPRYIDHFREKSKKLAVLHRQASWKPEPNGNSTDFLPGQMLTQGCQFGCTYCYTERHFLNNYPKLYDDVYNVVAMIRRTIESIEDHRDKMRRVAHKDFEKYRDPLHGDWITFDLGCDSDCTLDNDLTSHEGYPGHIIDIMNRVSSIKGAKTSFATKSANLDKFIANTINPSHHRIRLSLMPEHHRRILEINTSPIDARLNTVNKLVEAGFEVHLNLSPIVVTESFEEEYKNLLMLIDSTLSDRAKSQMAYEIIFLTHSLQQYQIVSGYAPKAHTMMTAGPLQLVPKPNKPNVLSYSRGDKQQLKKILSDLIKEFTPYARVRYCY